MIELRYNEDGKLEYRTQRLTTGIDGGLVPLWELIKGEPRSSIAWNEWKIVPSEQTKSYTSGIVTNNHTSGIVWVHREAVDALIEEERRDRDSWKILADKSNSRVDTLTARVAQLEAEKQTLLESEMWGVNCKPSASNAEPVAWGVMLKNESPQVVVGNPSPWKHMYLYFMKHDADEWKSKHGGTVFPLYTEPQAAKGWLTEEERKTLLRISYNLDYVQFATSADFIRSLLARLTPKVKEAGSDISI